MATARAVDLTNVKEGVNFRPRRKPAGDYRGKVVKVEDHKPKDTTKPMGWVFTIQVEGDARSTYPYYVNPSPKEAWKIRAICVAVGINVKMTRIKFDPNKLVNKALGLELEDDEYEGREKSVIADVFPVDEVGSARDGAPEGDEVYDDDEPAGDDEEYEEEEEEVAPPKRPASRRRKAPEPEPEEDYEEDEIEEEEEPPPPPRKRTTRRRAPEPEEEEEEEEPPAPTRRRRTTPDAKKVAAPTRRRKAPEPEDDDLDLDDLDE